MTDVFELSATSCTKKTKIIIGASVGAAVLIIVIVLAVVLSPRSQYTPYSLPVSSSGQLLRLVRTDQQRIDGSNPVVARSYGGNPWENVADLDFPLDVTISCQSSTSCTVVTPGTYTVQNVSIPDSLLNPTASAQFGRLLSQGTFGASKNDLQTAVGKYNTDYSSWIKDQINIPPTLHRVYYRQRTNPRILTTTPIGEGIPACQAGSRWHQYVFEDFDEGSTLVVSNVSGYFNLEIDGILRGQITTFPATVASTFPASLTICTVTEQINGTIKLSNGGPCNLTLLNPAIQFSTPNLTTTLLLTAAQAQFSSINTGRTDVLILRQLSAACSLSNQNAFIRYNGTYYRYEMRLRLLANTLTSPANTTADGSVGCPTSVKTFLNSQYCQRRPACQPLTYSATLVPLNDTVLRDWYVSSGRYVYYTLGLRLEQTYAVSPCNGTSRWQRLGSAACPNPATLSALTLSTFIAALTNSTDTNPYVRDIVLTGANCTANAATIGAQVYANGECFQHVHPDLFSVRDFNFWVSGHPGNTNAIAANQPLPISLFAEQGSTSLTFPDFHPMDRWASKSPQIAYIGRYGDSISFKSLSTQLQTASLATLLGVVSTQPGISFQACGSPGEEANVPTLGHRYIFPDQTPSTILADELEWPRYYSLYEGKSIIWENVVLSAPDQLRQRVSWALSQIFIISAVSIAQDNANEPWCNYYDIFVRNAFGNYRDIMKEVSYSPMMGGYLTYLQNKAFAFANNYPDENYARELMQLFSIGLWRLNDDYTQVKDSNGNSIPTYTNEDIVDFARVWTGFDYQATRSNIEEYFAYYTPNSLDPMQVRPVWRDKLPKAKLDDGFLGDIYPLCDSLPPQHWLTIGARWEYTGSSSIEGATMDAESPSNVGYHGRFAPSPSTSALYKLLCSPDSTGKCTFPGAVVLTQNIACDGAECNAGRIISAKIVDVVANVTQYYTYISTPCVRLTFYDQGQVTAYRTYKQCTNPVHRVGFPVCCQLTNPTRIIDPNAKNCLFANEAMDYQTAMDRCVSANYSMCNGTSNPSPSWNRTCSDAQYMWVNATCNLQVQIYPSGQIAIVDPNVVAATTFKILLQSSNNVFRVRWNGDNYPKATAGCPSTCVSNLTVLGNTCVCPIKVVEGAVYTDPTYLPTQQELASELFIGAANPASFGSGIYVKCTTGPCASRTDVFVWTKAGSSGWDASTIFEVPSQYPGNPNNYLANVNSTVYVGSYYFRNPPHFMPLTGEQVNSVQWGADALWQSRATQEVDALLDHLFQHQNTPAFVCYRLIQHLVTSNPSPRYMRACASAFRTGTYNGNTFSGRYGDLGATVTAILSDVEARSPILEADPSFGMLREPVVKLLQFLRAMEYTSRDGREVVVSNTENLLGMQVYRSATVFGYYLPENRPDGAITNIGLVSPEAQIAIAPYIVGYLNGMVSLIDNGLSSCSYGFGYTNPTTNCRTPNTTSDGKLQYTPASGLTPDAIIAELDLLLTNGRLNDATRDYLIQQYITASSNNTNPAAALKLVQKYMISTAEFHTTSANILTNYTRTQSKKIPSQHRPYKAIVVVFQLGGCDSYNVLVPYGNCSTTGSAGDLSVAYNNVRGLAAIPQSSLLPIQVPAGQQACNTFAVHPSLPTVQNLYNNGDALFMSNIGALVEPISKADFFGTSGKAVRLPPSLFAHNVMQRSMQNLDPQNADAKGILGRITSALTHQAVPYASAMYSTAGTLPMLQGDLAPNYINPYIGVVQFQQYKAMLNGFTNITDMQSQSAFSDTYLQLLNQSLSNTQTLGALLANVTLSVNFSTMDALSLQLAQVAKLIKLRDQLETERAVFVTELGGFDTHNTFDLTPTLGSIEAGLASFSKELKAQGMWDNVAIVSLSEFGRTMTSNGAGTDHAWGANHFVCGGKVKGGQILGQYPDTLTDDGPLSVGRGRYIPTTSWEGLWNGVAQWFGVENSQLAGVLPNLKNFPSNKVFTENELFNP